MTSPAGDRSVDEITGRLLLLAERLRRAGVPVGMTELIDAFGATAAVGVMSREAWRLCVRACLVKRSEHLATFDDLFDRLFPLTSPLASLPGMTPASLGAAETRSEGLWQESGTLDRLADDITAGAMSGLGDGFGLLDRVVAAIAKGDADALRRLAHEAVDAHAGLRSGGSTERQYLLRVTRTIDLANLMQRALREARLSGPDAASQEAAPGGSLAERLTRSDVVALVEQFRKLLAREVTRRLAELTPVETFTTVKYPDDVAFLEATVTQRVELRRVVRPLAQKLAARMAQRRRLRRTGRVDVRRTVRRSLAFGGSPFEPAFKSKRASRPDLVVLCDVSGSVAEFAHFMLTLVHALHEELQRLRTFVFVDGIAEVTQLFAAARHDLEPMHLLSQPGVVRGDGHSDHGAVFSDFLRIHAPTAVKRTTTVIVTGDARNNYRDPGVGALSRLADSARALYWLNPEPEAEWDTTDSVIELYRPLCDGVFEVRTARQLAAAVLEIDAASR